MIATIHDSQYAPPGEYFFADLSGPMKGFFMSNTENPLRIVVVGITGRTGHQIGRLADRSRDFQLVAGVAGDRGCANAANLRDLGLTSDAPVIRSLGDAPAHLAVIDFSTPELTHEIASVASDRGAALIVGTTGILSRGMDALKSAASKVPVVVSPNMSIGVNLLFALTQNIASALSGGWDIEIVEAHHRKKVDAPSGTAVKLAELARAGGEDLQWVHGREGAVGARGDREIGIHALRGGDIVGEHTVFFVGDGERIELTHRATDRKIFAQGALRAASWACAQDPGFYSMNDVLGLSDF
jgi:4-hydroxy-tetrahydrodipicolinate reductase